MSRYSPFALTSVAGILLMISIFNPDVWKNPRTTAADTFSPVISAVGAPFRFAGETFGEITGLGEIRSENARLKSENEQLKEWYQTAMLLRAENQSLKDLLNVIPEPDQSYITTRVIGDSASSYIRTLLLQAGMQDGVVEGQAVMGGKGMIGRVIEVGEKASRILLLTDINSRVPVIIEGINQRAILAGNNDDILSLIHLPPEVLVSKGLRIVTSGSGGQFPAGLPIGEITQTRNGQIMVEMFSDPSSAGYVQIVEKPMDPDVRKSLDALITIPERRR